jgi:Na+/proline symporter
VFLGFAFLTNLLVTQMLLLGGAAAVHQFTGMHVWAAAALIPVGVIIYTMMGGLRHSFPPQLLDYLNRNKT